MYLSFETVKYTCSGLFNFFEKEIPAQVCSKFDKHRSSSTSINNSFSYQTLNLYSAIGRGVSIISSGLLAKPAGTFTGSLKHLIFYQ